MKKLKIVDNVDLKELEKFGFIYYDNCGIYEYKTVNNQALFIRINSWNRKIYLFSNTNSLNDEDIILKLYDLIKANLVEVVEDDR